MNAMVPGLQGAKMSSSDPNSKIDFLDPPNVVRQKLKKAFCEPGNVAENGVLSFVQAVLMPVSELRLERLKAESEGLEQTDGTKQLPFALEGAPEGTLFSTPRAEQYGGAMHYKSFQELKDAFAAEEIHPGDLKTAVANSIVELLTPIQKAYEENEEWQKVTELAYPTVKEEKKKKKEKVYHPPPPGKGKNATKPSTAPAEGNGAASAEPSAPATPPAEES